MADCSGGDQVWNPEYEAEPTGGLIGKLLAQSIRELKCMIRNRLNTIIDNFDTVDPDSDTVELQCLYPRYFNDDVMNAFGGLKRTDDSLKKFRIDDYNAGGVDFVATKLDVVDIPGSKFPNSFTTDGSHAIGAGETWVPDAGLYNFTGDVDLYLKIDASPADRPFLGGAVLCDGEDIKIYNSSGDSITVYYQKWD